MIVAVQDQLHAVPLQEREQGREIGQPLEPGLRTQGMMDQQHAKRLFGGEPCQHALQRVELAAPEPSGRHQGRRRDRRRRADQCQRAAPAQQWKADAAIGRLVAAQIISPGFRKAMPRGADIGVVIAGNHRDAIRRTDAFQPGPRRRKLRVQRQVDEVAGDRDLVRRLRLHVRYQRVEHIAPVDLVPVARPVEIAERAFSREIAQPRRGHWRQMRIGQMGQRKCRHQPGPLRCCGTEPLRDHLVIPCEIPGKVLASRLPRRKDQTRYQDIESAMAMTLQKLRKTFEPALRRIFHLYWRFARGMTLGVRAVVLDGDDRVFLVKHSYVAGWHLPGGGVEVGQTFAMRCGANWRRRGGSN